MDADALRRNIDTIVIVMLENRSFDHLLGHLSHEQFGKRKDVDGLHVKSANFDFGNPDDEGNLYDPAPAPDGWLPGDLPHGRTAIAAEMNGGAMTGFVSAYLQANPNDREANPPPMRFCRPEDVPTTGALAAQYCVCDRWFSSLPADTQTNRCMAVSGYTLIDSAGHVAPPGSWLPDHTTVLDWLASKGLPFEIYVDAPFIPLVGRPSNFMLMRSQWRHLTEQHVFGLDELERRWRASSPAPAVVYCEPYYNDVATHLRSHGNCNHPPLPVALGEMFLKRVYDALTQNPERWKRTVLVLCYDEHGGFFDHVPPPRFVYAPPANAHWQHPEPFTTLGCRVPALVISPYVDANSVCSQRLDHTSILQFIVERFGAPADLSFFGSAPARKASLGIGSISAVLTRSAPRADAPPVPTAGLGVHAFNTQASDNARLFAAALSAKAKAPV